MRCLSLILMMLPALVAASPATSCGAAGRGCRWNGLPAASAALVPADTSETGPAARRAPAPGGGPAVDFLWVMRVTLLHPEEFPDLIARAREMGVRGLLVQVVGRGDAYYRSDLLPRAESLERVPEAGRDAFVELVERAHRAGLEVHAWMNCMLAWSAPERPRDPRHVTLAHPEWVARLRDGRRLSALSVRQRARLRIEGAFLAPANPGVRHFVAAIASEIARRYPVDGIHLDYIRQPAVAIGYDPDTRARFALASGVDPLRFAAVPAAGRAAVDSAWSDFQREQVTAVVREVRDSLATVRAERDSLARERSRPAWPGPVPAPRDSLAGPARALMLSAAVVADTVTARDLEAQDWPAWVREGLIDRAFVMCYAASVQTVMNQLLGYSRTLGVGERVVPGIAVYNTRPALAAAKILGARSLGFPLLALYSSNALDEHPGYWPALKVSLVTADTGRP